MTQAIEQAVCDILGACQPVKINRQAQGVQPLRYRAGERQLPHTAHTPAPGDYGFRTRQSERLHHRGMGGALHGQYLVCRMDRPERQGDL